MTTYEQVVNENLKHMGTIKAEWMAVPVVRMVEAQDGNRSVQMPEFKFPEGYTSAPTMFASQGTEAVCGLCGKTIKNCYWIQNDSKKWTLMVGSECVTHFGEGKSGAELSKETQDELNLKLLVDFENVKSNLWKGFAIRLSLGYGRYETRITNHAVSDLYYEMKKLFGKMEVGGEYKSSTASVSRWVNKNGKVAMELMELAAQAMTLPEVKENRKRWLRDMISNKESILRQFPNADFGLKSSLAECKAELAELSK
jgi:hypothetical protein